MRKFINERNQMKLDNKMSDLKEILDEYIYREDFDAVWSKYTEENLLKELRTYISNLLDSREDEILKNLYEHAFWFEKESGEGFGTYQLGIIIQQGRYKQTVEQYKAEQHKRIKAVKDNL